MELARSTYYDAPGGQSIGEARLIERIKKICAEWPYRAELGKHELKGSMGRRGNPYDNAKAEAGEFDDDLAAASILQEYEARIGALERLVGKLALENEFLKGASRHVRPPTSATPSVIAGPAISRSPKDAD